MGNGQEIDGGCQKEREMGWKTRIKICKIHVPLPHKDPKHYVLRTCTNNI